MREGQFMVIASKASPAVVFIFLQRAARLAK